MRHCCLGNTLRIALLSDSSSLEPLLYDGLPLNESSGYRGYIPALIDELSKEMGFEYSFQPVHPFIAGSGAEVANLVRGDFDACLVWLDDPGIAGSFSNDVVFSIPLVNFKSGAAVRLQQEGQSIWSFTSPYASDAWIAFLLCWVGSTILFVLVRALAPEQRGRFWSALRPKEFVCASYHLAAVLLGGDAYDWNTGPLRVFRVGMLLCAMIFISTYTANLASAFIAPPFSTDGPQDMTQLSQSKAFYVDADFAYVVEPFVQQLVVPSGEEVTMTDRIELGYKKLLDGEVDVLIADSLLIQDFVLRHCNDIAVVESISFSPYSLAMAFRADVVGRQFAYNVTMAAATFMTTPEHQTLTAHHFREGLACPPNDGGAEQIEGASMYVILGACFVTWFLALTLAVWRRFGSKTAEGADDVQGRTSDARPPTEDIPSVAA